MRVSSNSRALERILSDRAQKQLPFATALALTSTARLVAGVEGDEIGRTFKNPTPFTSRGVYVTRATKSRPAVEVGIKRVQAEYLRAQAEGGARTPSGRAILIPVGARVNKYGNLPRRAVAKLLARDDTFSGKISGVAGVWRRPKRRGGRPVLLVRYEDRVRYERKFDFQRPAFELVRREFPRQMAEALRRSLATAR